MSQYSILGVVALLFASTQSNAALQDGIYRFSQDVDVPVSQFIFHGDRSSYTEPVDFGFTRGEPTAVKIENGKAILTLLLPEDEKQGFPEKIVLTPEQMAKAGLKFVSKGDDATLAEKYTPYQETLVAGRGYTRSIHHSPHGMSCGGRMTSFDGKSCGCVAYVTNILGFRIPGNGRDIASNLIAMFHWRRADCNQRIEHMVGSWTGGPRGSGHAAIIVNGRFDDDEHRGPPGSGFSPYPRVCAAPPSNWASIEGGGQPMQQSQVTF